MKTMTNIIVIMTAILLITPNVFSADVKEKKIGYVDLYKVFSEYEKTKESETALKNKAEQKNKEREKMVREIKKLEEETELLSEKEKEKKNAQIEEKLKKLRDFDRATSDELDREKDSMGRDVLLEINKTIVNYGQTQNFDLILDSRTLFYASDAIDISGKIIEEMNKAR